MSRNSARQRRLDKVADKRRDVEDALGVINRSLDQELSFIPSGRRWRLPTVAFAVGVALAGRGPRPDALEPPGDD